MILCLEIFHGFIVHGLLKFEPFAIFCGYFLPDCDRGPFLAMLLGHGVLALSRRDGLLLLLYPCAGRLFTLITPIRRSRRHVFLSLCFHYYQALADDVWSLGALLGEIVWKRH